MPEWNLKVNVALKVKEWKWYKDVIDRVELQFAIDDAGELADAVAHKKEVLVGWNRQFAAGRDGQESQKLESTNQDSQVRTILLEAHNAILALKRFFGIFQKCNERVLRRLREAPLRNLDVQIVAH